VRADQGPGTECGHRPSRRGALAGTQIRAPLVSRRCRLARPPGCEPRRAADTQEPAQERAPPRTAAAAPGGRARHRPRALPRARARSQPQVHHDDCQVVGGTLVVGVRHQPLSDGLLQGQRPGDQGPRALAARRVATAQRAPRPARLAAAAAVHAPAQPHAPRRLGGRAGGLGGGVERGPRGLPAAGGAAGLRIGRRQRDRLGRARRGRRVAGACVAARPARQRMRASQAPDGCTCRHHAQQEAR